MQIKLISSQDTKDYPFELSEHGAYLCAPQSWKVVPVQLCCTLIYVQPHEVRCFQVIASADKENKHWKWKENQVGT